MIRGARYWNDRERYYVQDNNPSDQMLKKAGVKDWLESCGPTSAVNCIAALGYCVEISCPGTYRPQPEEILMDFFHDSRNYAQFRELRRNLNPETFMGNRVPQYYPAAAGAVFGATARYIETHSFNLIAGYLGAGNAVQLCLLRPGHYIAAVAYDDETDEIVFNDSWPQRFPDGNGFNRRLDREEYTRNTQPWCVLYTEDGLK